jgi:hypothetical protein
MAQVMMRTGGFSRPCSIEEMMATRVAANRGRASPPLGWMRTKASGPSRHSLSLSSQGVEGRGREGSATAGAKRDSLAERRPHATASSAAV